MILESVRPKTFAEAAVWGQTELSRCGISNAKMEALWLLSQDAPVSETLLKLQNPLSPQEGDAYIAKIKSRSLGLPLAYILKSQDFMGHHFFVDPSVLIPRQDTGVLLREAQDFSESLKGGIRILDLGTGSGILAVLLAKHFPQAHVTAADISREALLVASMNATFHKAKDRVACLESDLFQSIAGEFDIIVSNPPYILSGDLPGLEREIHQEPQLALNGGPDGLRVIEKLIKNATPHLHSGGSLMIEVGHDQSETVTKLFNAGGFESVRSAKDESGIERVVIGQKP